MDDWFEMQLLQPEGWFILFDVDTVDEAGSWMTHLEGEYPEETYRIKRVSGLAA
jgi:hypothetical protein